MKFTDLPLSPDLLKNLDSAGFETATPVQIEAIPVIMDGHDLLGVAQTGTGKTAAFSLPIIQHLLSHPRKPGFPGPRALILAPTRELASQISESIKMYSKNLGIKSTAIFGGTNQGPQVKALKEGIDILVATPGRLIDLYEQKQVRLTAIEFFVLDEADRMLDMGFIEDIEKIIKELPLKKQSMFFSATMPPQVAGLAKKILSQPRKVEIQPSGTAAENVEQKLISCKREDKFQLLRKILKNEQTELVIIFTKTKDSAERVREYLRFHKTASMVIHGDKDQSDRERAMKLFKDKSIKYLIATDIAARGIDIPDVSHVINFELPKEAESYVHRIGRTARAGRAGVAITFFDESERIIIEKIQRLLNRTLPVETYVGSPEASGVWLSTGPMKKRVTAPTPGKSQEKTAYLDHSKRQKVLKPGEKAKAHPGFKGKKKKRK